MPIVLFDNQYRNQLFPLVQTRAVGALRMGLVTMQERWALLSSEPVYLHSAAYLNELYPKLPVGVHTWVDAAVVPDQDLCDRILSLEPNQCIADEQGLVAGCMAVESFEPENSVQYFEQIIDYTAIKRIAYPWELFQLNDRMIRADYLLVTKGRGSQPLSLSNNRYGEDVIFIEEDAKVEFCTINAVTGPVYIGKGAELMEGSVIRGPFAIGEGAVVKTNSSIYGATTVGPYCSVGGEIKNSILMGYSNKAHHGYLGDSVIGEWCNLGAGTTNSNVQNTAGDVKVWDGSSGGYRSAGLKCGVIMGDHSRTAINSAINTGSIIGVSCNVFGEGLLPKVIDNFSWGVGDKQYRFEKALENIGNWKKMKGEGLTIVEATILKFIFDQQL